MIQISLCMIVRNEEQSLANCLSSVQEIVDEIIIVDTGSSDRTKEIVAQYTDRIYDFEWINDFSAARNYAFSLATKPYILWLDADDLLKDRDRKLFLELKDNLAEDVDSVSMYYYLAFDDAGNPTSLLRRNRLVRRDRNFQWIGPVHEYLAVGGNILHSEIAITHNKNKVYTDRNLQIYLHREQAGEDFTARDLYYFANELHDNAQYEKAIGYYDKFLAGKQGWVEDNIQACLKKGDCFGKLGDKVKQIESMLATLIYDKPRAEFCCAMGSHYLEEDKVEVALYWYEQAVACGRDSHNMGLVNQAHYTWLPHLQLCLCYDRLGQLEKANEHNEIARTYHPRHPSILFNRNYFQQKFGNG